jgi:hypothetical protein
VLDGQGRIVDALPGLYGPASFERVLRESLDLARKSGELSDDESAKAVAKYHKRRLWALTGEWTKLFHRTYGEQYDGYLASESIHLPDLVKVQWSNPLYDSLPAPVVNQLTMSKADMEAPSIDLMQPQIHVSSPWDSGWTKMADKTPAEHIDARSRALLQEQRPRNWGKPDVPALDEGQLAQRIARFERGLREEQLRNEFALHGAIHRHLAQASQVAFATTNEFIYDKIFMTPRSDAWLGLMPTEALTALADDGMAEPRRGP